MNGYFKDVNVSSLTDEESAGSRVKEHPVEKPSNEPENTPKYALQSSPGVEEAKFADAAPLSSGTGISAMRKDNAANDADLKIHGEPRADSIEADSIENYNANGRIPPYSGRGGIIVQVYLARQALPLENVKVTVKSPAGAPVDINEVRYTDSSGKTEKIFLPAPDMHFSMQAQEDVQPYAVYGVTAELDGYYVEPEFGSDGVISALVFDNVCSIQNVEMIPDREKGV